MDGKKYFAACCKEMSIDCAATFQLGAQNPKDAAYWIYRCSYMRRKGSQLFAVCYFAAADIYIAWGLKSDRLGEKKSVFRLKKDDAVLIDTAEVRIARKNLEYAGWGEESVYVFAPVAVKTFLKKYCGGVK